MSNDIILALQITAVGMGLVFAAILLLWAVMALLVRVAADRGEPEAADEEAPTLVEAGVPSEVVAPALDRKHLAAAVAVAYALAHQTDVTEPHEFPLPPTPLVSAWQAIMRTRMLNKRGSTR